MVVIADGPPLDWMMAPLLTGLAIFGAIIASAFLLFVGWLMQGAGSRYYRWPLRISLVVAGAFLAFIIAFSATRSYQGDFIGFAWISILSIINLGIACGAYVLLRRPVS